MSGTVGLVVVAIGVIAGLASVALGGLFVTDDSFATAQRACNPSVRTNELDRLAAEANCVDDVVVDDNGDACQTANLGLYSASFTPECTYGTSYEINQELDPQVEVDPLELVPLFAAQNGFGSVGEGLGEVEFTDCESYFDTDAVATSPILGTGTYGQLLAAGSASGILTGVSAAVKAGFDATIDDSVDTLSTLLFAEAHINLIEGPANLVLAGAGLPFELDETTTFESEIPTIPGVGLIADLVIVAGLAGPSSGPIDNVIAILNASTALPAATPTRTVFQGAVAVGTSFSPTPGAITGLPDDGPWAAFDSDVLCAATLGDCTVIEYMTGVALQLASVSDPRADDINAAIGLFNGFLLGANINTSVAESLAAVSSPAVSTASVVAGVKAAAFSLAQPLFQDAPYVGPVNPVINDLNVTLADVNFGFPLLCEAGGEPATCKQEGLFRALANISYADEDTDTGDQLTLLSNIVATCVAFSTVTWTDCIDISNPVSTVQKGQLLWAATTQTLLSAFYDTSDFAVTDLIFDLDSFAEEMIAQCEDANLNGDAIALNQTTVPAGIALIAIGTIILAINLVVRGEKVKVIGVVGGVVALAGAIVALAGLLILQGSPIYSSLQEEEPEVKPDDANAFATGTGLLYALGFIGAGIVSSLCLLLGSLCLAPKEDESSAILGKTA